MEGMVKENKNAGEVLRSVTMEKRVFVTANIEKYQLFLNCVRLNRHDVGRGEQWSMRVGPQR